MQSNINKAGKYILILGVLMLIAGIVFTVTVGTIAVPILLSSSIIVNSLGITMMRHGR